jgi:hypothetical protein
MRRCPLEIGESPMFRRLNLTALVGLFVVVLMSGAQAVPNPMNLVSDLGVEEESTTEPAPEACSDEPAGSEEEDAEAADVEGDAAELEDTEAGDEHADEDSTCEEEGTGGSSVADEDGDGDEETDAETDGSDGEASAAQAKKVVQNHGAAVRIAAHCDVPGKLHGELVSSIAKDKEATPEQAESACEAAMASAGASSRGVDKGERSDKGPRGARGKGSEARTQKRDAGGSSAKNTESRGAGKGDEKKVGSGKPAGAGKPAGVGKPADAGAGKGRSKR